MCTGSIRSDELKDPTNVVSPVLELTVIEMPEGRSVFEVPANIIRGRLDETENVGNEDLDTLSEVVEEPTSRKHRHQHSSRTVHTSQEEQADEAVLRINNHPSKTSDATSSMAIYPDAKLRTSHRTGHHQVANHRPTSSPVPTLATLEDHDLFRETAADEEATRVDEDESHHVLRPSSIFMQRMMQHHQQQQFNSKMGHHSRAYNRKQ